MRKRVKIAVAVVLLGIVSAILLSDCGPGGRAGGSAGTNLSLTVWSSFPPPTNSYRHLEHLQNLLQAANTLAATNPAAFRQSQFGRKLSANSPLRPLLGIPADEPTYATESISTSASSRQAQRRIIVRSSRTDQRFGDIKINLQTGHIDSVHDAEALFAISEMECRLRQIVGTREEALRLFRGGLPNSPSPEQEQAAKALAAALFLPKDKKCHVIMSAPGGSNRGRGYLRVAALSSTNSWDYVAQVGYPTRDNLFSVFGLASPGHKFGGLMLFQAWTNVNTEGFLIDSNGFPYPRTAGP